MIIQRINTLILIEFKNYNDYRLISPLTGTNYILSQYMGHKHKL